MPQNGGNYFSYWCVLGKCSCLCISYLFFLRREGVFAILGIFGVISNEFGIELCECFTHLTTETFVLGENSIEVGCSDNKNLVGHANLA